VVSLENMKRFEKEQFKFVAKRDPSEFGVPRRNFFDNFPEQDEEDAAKLPEEDDGTIEFVRITRDGYEYIAKYGSSELARGGSTEPEPNPQGSQVGGSMRRSLVVIGTDTRSLITNTESFPHRAIAEVDYSPYFEGGCTSTLISRNAALTAAHCVYSKRYLSIDKIAPARYRSGSRTIEPYGTWEVDYSTTFSQWRNEGSRSYDIAVMTLLPRQVSNEEGECENLYPGDAVGFVGIASPSVGDSRLDEAKVTGYPADKANGQMWTSGACSPGWKTAETYFGYHFCDTNGGNSGSSVLTTDNIALGVHGYGFTTSSNEAVCNGACLMQGSHYDAVYEWSDLGKSLPDECGETEQECPCVDITFRLFRSVCNLIYSNECL
jgi:V8-like Glu-specific endopeptidase